MKKNYKKLLTASLVIAASYSGGVLAHNQTGSLGIAASGAAATDTYQVTCSDDGSGVPNQLFVEVADLKLVAADVKATLVSTQISNGYTATSTVLSEDPVDGDAAVCTGTGNLQVCTGGFSPGVTLAAGTASAAQNYIVNVNKQYTASTVAAQKGIENYNLIYHCQTATGVHTGTSMIQTQNQ